MTPEVARNYFNGCSDIDSLNYAFVAFLSEIKSRHISDNDFYETVDSYLTRVDEIKGDIIEDDDEYF